MKCFFKTFLMGVVLYAVVGMAITLCSFYNHPEEIITFEKIICGVILNPMLLVMERIYYIFH